MANSCIEFLTDLEMKHCREPVIVFLAAMQGCSYLKSRGIPESHREMQHYGNHPTLLRNKRIYSHQKQHKIVFCVYQISVCKICQIQTPQSKSFFACTSQILLFSIHMSRSASAAQEMIELQRNSLCLKPQPSTHR